MVNKSLHEVVFRDQLERLKDTKETWWDKAKRWFKEDKKGAVDESDPEYDAQKIYTHYLTVLGIKK